MSMVSYYAYNADGEIVATGICDESAVAGDHLPPGATVVIGSADPFEHYVSGGQLRAYTVSQREAKSNRPSLWVRWSNSAMSWVDPRAISDRRAKKWADVKASRDAMEFGEFTWDGSRFDCDMVSQLRLQIAYDGAREAIEQEASFEQPWKLADNTFRVLSAADVVLVKRAQGENTKAAHLIAAGLWAQITTAEEPEDLEAITWPST
jgi:Domain of unknown function (DUF4376)